MTESLDTKLIKLSLGKLKEFIHINGYAELFEKHAGAVIALLQAYGSSEEVKCLMTEYDKVLRQAKVFDQLPKHLLTFTSDKVKNDREEHVKVEISLRRIINEFRYHIKDIVSKIENGKLKPEKPAETEQKEIVEVKPGVFGITVDIKELARRFWKRVCSRSKD